MTLTELRYIVSVAKKKHFGRAAQTCHVSQPTLSIAIKKLEDELLIRLFERGSKNEVRTTEIGQKIVDQACIVLQEAQTLGEIAQRSKDPFAPAQFKLGIIYTIGPYLLPAFISPLTQKAPHLTLIIEENFTANLLDSLRQGVLDAIIISYPFKEPGIATLPLYEEPFVVAIPQDHDWRHQSVIRGSALSGQNLMLLGAGHCFRDQVIDACPGCLSGSSELNRILEGSSLETIRHMVAAGTGITVLPRTSIVNSHHQAAGLIHIKPFVPPAPSRTVAIAWRKNFPRTETIHIVRDTIQSLPMADVEMIHKT